MHTIVKNIQQNKTILMVKQGKPKALSRQRAIYNGEKDVHEFFWRSQEYIGILAVHGAQYLSSPGS